MEEEEYVYGTVVPERYLPLIGRVTISHNQMDHTINRLIWHLAGIDSSKGGAITSSVKSTATRLEIVRKLIPNAENDETIRLKLEILRQEACRQSGVRNRLSHDIVAAHEPSLDMLFIVKQEALIDFPNKEHPEHIQTPESLIKIAADLEKVSRCIDLYLASDTRWQNDAEFPWFAKLRQERYRGRNELDA